MRKYIKEQMLDMITTLDEAHKEISKHIKTGEINTAIGLMAQCQNSAVAIGTTIEKSEGVGSKTLKYLEEYCEMLFHFAESLQSEEKAGFSKLKKQLVKIENSIEKDIETKIEIAFLPYKASMWDSLESVWIAAKDDPQCDAYVIPIPYYERLPDGSFGQFHYEGGDMPEYVPITPYDRYDLSVRRPDIIYIHNPYDQGNYVTSVDPRFYSFELKKYTDCLVYVPYFIAGVYANAADAASFCCTSAANYADYIIVQSEKHKKLYIENGCPKKKLIVAGTPKIDYVLNHINDVPIPDEWIKKAEGKKVFLINTTIGNFLIWPDYFKKYDKIFSDILENDACVLLWRPHPLFEATITSMRPQMLQDYKAFVAKFSEYPNFIIDKTPDPLPAMACSDMLISDYSSLVFSYIVTGKPVVSVVCGGKPPDSCIYCFDFRKNYFLDIYSEPDRPVPDEMNPYINMELNGNDTKSSERLEAMKRSVVNFESVSGTCIHKTIKEIIFMLNTSELDQMHLVVSKA
jgi:hypothetical protein